MVSQGEYEVSVSFIGVQFQMAVFISFKGLQRIILTCGGDAFTEASWLTALKEGVILVAGVEVCHCSIIWF